MVIALAGTTACSGSGKASSSSPVGKTIGGQIGNPKPAGGGSKYSLTGTDFCKALTPESLTAIGIQPSEAEPKNASGKSGGGGCYFGNEDTTDVEIRFIPDMDMNDFGAEYDRKFNILGFAGGESDSLGYSCQITLQANADEIELNVENMGSDNPALEGPKSCAVGHEMAKQLLSKIVKK